MGTLVRIELCFLCFKATIWIHGQVWAVSVTSPCWCGSWLLISGSGLPDPDSVIYRPLQYSWYIADWCKKVKYIGCP